jgi:TPR repeat protein
MEEYKKALLLREEGKFDEGRVLLKKAAELGHECALRELQNMYIWGGWGVHRNVKNFSLDAFLPLTVTELSLAIQEHGFCFMTEMLARQLMWIGNTDEARKFFEVAAEKGSAGAYHHLSKHTPHKEKREFYLLKAHAQRMHHASRDLFNLYWQKQKYKQAMEVFEQTTDTAYALNGHMESIVSCECKYIVGRSVAILPRKDLSLVVLDTLPYYRRLYGYAQSATITWMLIAKQVGLYKDVARLIGKLIFASRETPSIWEKTGDNKRVCLR